MIVDYNKLMQEYAKCYSDKSRIYMIQNYLKTFDGTQGKEVPFLLFPRQQILCKTLGYGTGSIATTKYRQAGITTVTAGFITCQACLTDKASPITVLIIGNTLDLAQQMLYKIKNFLLQLPLWMWGNDYFDPNDKTIDITKPPIDPKTIFTNCNGKEIILKNGCKIYARSSGPNASRGISACHYLIFDECAFIENGGEVYTSALPTTSSVNGKAIFVSTPNGKDTLYYETCRRAKLKGTPDWNNFDLVEMYWYQDPRYNRFLEWTKKNENGEIDILKEDVLDKMGNVRYDEDRWIKLKQEGWSPRSPWYIKMCKQFNNDSQKIAQELDVSFLGSANNVIDAEFIEMQNNLNVREPMKKGEDGDIFGLEETWIWKPPIPGHKYICSCDPSRGDGQDRTAIEILDVSVVDDYGKPYVEQVLEYHGKQTGDVVGELIYGYATLYGNAFVVIDCVGGVGDAAILTLMHLGYKNLYYDDPNLKNYTMQREASSLKLTKDGRLPGFHSSSIRFQVLTFFSNMVKTNQIRIRSKRVTNEMDTWIYKGDAGRIDHMDGCHDDTLTCLAMGVFIMQYHLNDLEKTKERDAKYLQAWVNASNIKSNIPIQRNPNVSSEPKQFKMPFYTGNENKPKSPYSWIIF